MKMHFWLHSATNIWSSLVTVTSYGFLSTSEPKLYLNWPPHWNTEMQLSATSTLPLCTVIPILDLGIHHHLILRRWTEVNNSHQCKIFVLCGYHYQPHTNCCWHQMLSQKDWELLVPSDPNFLVSWSWLSNMHTQWLNRSVIAHTPCILAKCNAPKYGWSFHHHLLSC